MLKRHWFPIALLAVAAAFAVKGCDCTGESSISLSADPVEIPADGISYTTVTARVIYRDSVAEDDTTVSFDTTAGSFEEAGSGRKQDTASTAAGNATIMLYSSTEVGDVTVNASYVTKNDETITASITVKFKDVSDLTPVSMDHFDFSCESRNLGALDSAVGKVMMACDIIAKTAAGERIIRPPVKFLAEAGSLDLETPDDTTTPSYAIYATDGERPQDVDPNPDEPSVTDSTGTVHNPRDGLATIVAYMKGEEGFNDENGNGEYDVGEGFTDIGEPFVDADDNGAWNSGEPFVDVNGNSQYDPANGQWDGDTQIWRAFKVLWTGRMEEGSDFSNILPSSIDVPHLGSSTYVVKIVDANLNPLAADDPDDYISIEVEGGESPDTGDKNCQNSNSAGMNVKQSVNGDDIIEGGFDLDRTWSVTIKDSYDHEKPEDGGFDEYPSELVVRLYYTPGPKSSRADQYLDRKETDDLRIDGTIK